MKQAEQGECNNYKMNPISMAKLKKQGEEKKHEYWYKWRDILYKRLNKLREKKINQANLTDADSRTYLPIP